MFWPNHRAACLNAAMVGPPKTLGDLRRVDAAMEVKCNACGHIELLDRVPEPAALPSRLENEKT
jgi:hypothetical protein